MIRASQLIFILLILPAALFARQYADGDGAYATGRYLNLFKEAGYSDHEIKRKINAAFTQLFEGASAQKAWTAMIAYFL